MAVDEKKNNKPIYRVEKLEDIAKIPDEHIREFALDAFKALLQQIAVVAPLGITFGGLNFQPNGLGEIDYNLIKGKSDDQ
jgi:hypothetical protein